MLAVAGYAASERRWGWAVFFVAMWAVFIVGMLGEWRDHAEKKWQGDVAELLVDMAMHPDRYTADDFRRVAQLTEPMTDRWDTSHGERRVGGS